MFRNEYILAGLNPGSFTGGVVPGYGTRAQARRRAPGPTKSFKCALRFPFLTYESPF
ncbi:hypothetical protein DIPPA_01782 [Diplonema papillatum]|nr:hypothetical protein DIPPA_16219 [Diplonema papillatum]KAJ9469348.1 hypothetical protein DIPPA_01782 [Diplonema papillatum]